MIRKNVKIEFCNFSKYLHVINRIPLLSLWEEKIFLLKLKNDNDALAAHYLIISHLRYVVKVAKSYLCFGFLLADLVQEGSIGLIKSIKKYDLSKNTRLISFAIYWIKAEIFKYIIKNWEDKKNVEKVGRSFYKVQNTGVPDYGANVIYDESNDSILLGNRNGCFFFTNSFNSTEIKLIFKYLIFEIIVKLKYKKRMLFFRRWFQNDYHVLTLKFLSFYFSVSNEYIRQLEFKIIKKIRILMKFFL